MYLVAALTCNVLQQIITGGTAADREAHIQQVHSDEPSRAAARARLDAQDRSAKSDVLLFLGPLMQRRYVRFQDGSSIWTDLWLQFRNWEGTRGPALWQQLQELWLGANERVGAFGQRAELLQHELADMGRAVTNRTMIDAMLSGWLKEHPEWDVIVQSMRTTFSVKETVATVTQRLTQQEVEQTRTLRMRSPAAFAAVPTPAADEQRWCRIEAALQQVMTAVAGLQQGAGRGPTGQGASRQGTTTQGVEQRQRRCFRCGSANHMWRECPHPYAGQGALSNGVYCSEWMLDSGCTHDMHHKGVGQRRCYRCDLSNHAWRDCPHPFAGQGTLQCTPAAVCGSRWMVDSGCSDDMHPGGSLGESAFVNCRRFEQPLAVHLAKRGAHTHAVGVGQMELRGCTGTVVLGNVLHVPELDHPLFSVRQALAHGWDVTFTHSKIIGSAEEVAVIHERRIVLTGRGQRNRGDAGGVSTFWLPVLGAHARQAICTPPEV
jgi:hypothetical protein